MSSEFEKRIEQYTARTYCKDVCLAVLLGAVSCTALSFVIYGGVMVLLFFIS